MVFYRFMLKANMAETKINTYFHSDMLLNEANIYKVHFQHIIQQQCATSA